MAKLRLRASAGREIDEIELYIARDDPARALEFVPELYDYCQSLADGLVRHKLAPFAGEGIRQARFGNYLIFYRDIPGGIEVEHVIHARRNLPRLFADDSD